MTRLLPFTSVMTTAAAFAALCTGAGAANADGFSQNNLVSNMPGLATTTDSQSGEPLGCFVRERESHLDFGPGHTDDHSFWGDGRTGVERASVHCQHPARGSRRPDRAGRQRNAGSSSAGFDVSTMSGGNGAPADFIFADLNGSISAWNGSPNTQALTQKSVAGASFTGLAINQADTELFAANTAGAGGIDVFNSSFQQISGR